jgi:hypothetical protein
MQNSANSAVMPPSVSHTQLVEDTVRQKLTIEPTEVVSNDQDPVLTLMVHKKPPERPKSK